jgi:hypothetical protein
MKEVTRILSGTVAGDPHRRQEAPAAVPRKLSRCRSVGTGPARTFRLSLANKPAVAAALFSLSPTVLTMLSSCTWAPGTEKSFAGA